jgi:tRNA/tmRNA/rRNA uracil-C5-methylase (TrmA/RlmC/RlmD family)
VREQLRRLAGIELTDQGLPDVVVEPVPGDDEGLGWRTRVRFTVDGAGRPGLRRHRSHDVVPIPLCPIAHPRLNAVGVGAKRWRDVAAVDVVVSGDGGADPLVVVEPADSPGTHGAARRVDVPALGVPVSSAVRGTAVRGAAGLQRLRGRTWVEEGVVVDGVERRFRVTGSGFWQVHPGAAQTLLDAVLEATAPRPGERAFDLYCGVGLFASSLGLRVGERGTVLGVEGDERACADARRNLHDLPQVTLQQGRVDRVLAALGDQPHAAHADVVVLDPPRAGAGRAVIEAVCRLGARVVAYVACDPAALARDLEIAAANGYRLSGLRAFDLFPMTHHVECLATLVPVDPPSVLAS